MLTSTPRGTLGSRLKRPTNFRVSNSIFSIRVASSLAGLPEADEFHLDPGRLCVLMTRHRHACIVVGRESDRTLLHTIPPSTPAYLGWDPDPMYDGWEFTKLCSRLWKRTV